jgi:hypothetical protein
MKKGKKQHLYIIDTQAPIKAGDWVAKCNSYDSAVEEVKKSNGDWYVRLSISVVKKQPNWVELSDLNEADRWFESLNEPQIVENDIPEPAKKMRRLRL